MGGFRLRQKARNDLCHGQSAACYKSEQKQGDDNNENAEIGTGEVAHVDVGGSKGKNDDEDPSHNGKGKEDLVAKISPHRNRFVVHKKLLSVLVVDLQLGKTTLRGFTVGVGDVKSGFLHSVNDLVQRDLAGVA